MHGICMFLCVSVNELDSHPDRNKGPDMRTLHWSTDSSYRLYILATLYSRQLTLWLHDLCLEVLTVLVMSCAWLGSIPPLRTIQCLRALGITFNFFSYEAVLGRASSIRYQGRASNPSLSMPSGCATCYATSAVIHLIQNNNWLVF